MTDRRADTAISGAFRSLEDKARRKDVELDGSFYVELENYCRHKGVEDLPEPALKQVIETIGEDAIERAAAPLAKFLGRPRRAGGGVVRATILDRCRDPFSDCFAAAQTALKKLKKPETTS